MNPRIRLYSLAAAGLVVALVGFYLFNRATPDSNVGGSPSPVVTPAPTISFLPPTLVPAELRQVWMSGPRPIPGLEADAGVRLVLDESGNLWMTPPNLNSTRVLESRVEVLTGIDGFRLRSGPTDGGAYHWTLSESGETLEVVVEGDDCGVRLAAVPGTYWRMDCPTADDNCLGVIDAGSYGSQFFDHMVMPGGEWTPRYGALAYTVPDGWVNVEDWPDYFRLAPAGAADDTFIQVVKDVVLSTRADACSATADSDAASTPEGIAAALGSTPGLDLSAAEPVTIGGLTGIRVDIALEPGWTATCPFSEGRPHQELFTDRLPAEGYSAGIEPGERNRAYLLEPEEGRTTLIVIWAKEAAFDAFVDDAATVVESMTFTP
jgi:hypothetical protein